MAEKDLIRMSLREAKRLKAIQEEVEGQITQRVADFGIELSERRNGENL